VRLWFRTGLRVRVSSLWWSLVLFFVHLGLVYTTHAFNLATNNISTSHLKFRPLFDPVTCIFISVIESSAVSPRSTYFFYLLFAVRSRPPVFLPCSLRAIQCLNFSILVCASSMVRSTGLRVRVACRFLVTVRFWGSLICWWVVVGLRW
jgi:hypothetical protein